ncbi:methylated-DNA--[protein]-cysteine S-methyltransferase [Gemmatimonadota bacterium]
MSVETFYFESPLTSLAVTTNGEVLTNIRFGKHAIRAPSSRLELLVANELREYFVGERKHFTFPIEASGTEFNRTVWDLVARIPYGQTVTYGEIARDLGNSGAARAVGTANGRNPIPIVIPCHRVVAAGGKLGGFGGGLPLKRKLLDLECSNSPALG